MKIWNTKEIIMKSFLEVYWGWRYIKKFQWKLIRSVQVRLEVFWTGLFKGKNQTWLKGESILPSSLVEKLGDLEKKNVEEHSVTKSPFGPMSFPSFTSFNQHNSIFIYIYIHASVVLEIQRQWTSKKSSICLGYFLPTCKTLQKVNTLRSLRARPWKMMVGRRSFLFGMAKIQGPPTDYGATAGLLKYQQYLLVHYHQRDVRTQKSNLIPSIHMLVHPVFFKDTPLFLRCNSERFGTWVHKTQKLYRTLGVLAPSNSAQL